MEKIRNIAIWVIAGVAIIAFGLVCRECGRSERIVNDLSSLKTKVISDSTKFAGEIYGTDSTFGVIEKVAAVEEAIITNRDSIATVKKEVANAKEAIITNRDSIATVKKEVARVNKVAENAEAKVIKARREVAVLKKQQAQVEKNLSALKDSLQKMAEKQHAEALDFLKSQTVVPPPPTPEIEAEGPPAQVIQGQGSYSGIKNAPANNEPVAIAPEDEKLSRKKHWRYR